MAEAMIIYKPVQPVKAEIDSITLTLSKAEVQELLKSLAPLHTSYDVYGALAKLNLNNN